jgi:hypothetical protein
LTRRSIAGHYQTTGVIFTPDITQITGPDSIVFWANSKTVYLWMKQYYSTGPKLNFELPDQQTDALAFVGRAKRAGFSINVTE